MHKNLRPREKAIALRKKSFPESKPVQETIVGRRNGKLMPLLYRPFAEQDSPACSKILTENFVDSMFWGTGFPTSQDMAKARRAYSQPFIRHTARKLNYRTVLLGQEVVGVCGFIQEENQAKMVDISVAMARQGNGIGDFMVGTLIDEISSIERVSLIYLYSSPIAFGLYQRHGFVVPVYAERELIDSNGNLCMERLIEGKAGFIPRI